MKYLISLIAITVSFGSIAYAANPYIFTSAQVGASPVNTYCLTTDGTNSTWAPCSSGGGSGSGTVSTSSPLVSGQSVYATGVDTIASAANMLWNNATSLLSITGNASTTQFTSTGNAYLATSGGNVGIGTTSPSTLLHLSSSVPTITFTDTDAPSFVSSIDANSGAGGFTVKASRFLDLYTNGSNRLRIDSSGNVGIGTTTPSDILEINTSTANRGLKIVNTDPGASGVNLRLFHNSASPAASDVVGQIAFNGNNSSVAEATYGQIRGVIESSSSNGSGALTFLTAQTGSVTEKLRVTSAGYVGIGTTTPGFKTQITSTNAGGGTTPLLLQNFDSTTNTAVSLGFSPFGGTPSSKGALTSTRTGGGTYSLALETEISGVLAPRLLIGATGNIGIGTTTPGSLLSVGDTNGINFTTATSTFSSTGGINLASGCFAIAGTCIGGGGSGTVTSVAMTVPTGLAISGSPITTSGTLALSLDANYNIPLTASTTNWNSAYDTVTAGSSNWDSAYTNRITSINNDTNVIGSIGSNAITLGWTGTLADSRIASAATWNAKQSALGSLTGIIMGNAGSFYGTATSSPIALSISGNAATATTLSGVLSSSLGGAGSVSGILKANGSGTVSAAVSSTDYAPATSGTSILKGNGSGGFSSAANGTDYTLLTATTCTSGDFVSALSASGGVTCTTPAGGSVAGSALQVQYNNYGSFGASSGFTFSTSTGQLYIAAGDGSAGYIQLENGDTGTGLKIVGGNGPGSYTATFPNSSGTVCYTSTCAGTVTSVGLSDSNGTLTIGGTPVTTTGTLTATLNLAHANTWTALQSFANASSTQFSAASETFYINSAGRILAKDTTTGFSGALTPMRNLVLQSATTTAWTATTSGAYINTVVMPFAGTIRTAKCTTDTGTLNVDIYHTSTHLSLFNASTTVGTITFSSNNTVTAGEKLYMVAGNPASTPTSVSCTLGITETF